MQTSTRARTPTINRCSETISLPRCRKHIALSWSHLGAQISKWEFFNIIGSDHLSKSKLLKGWGIRTWTYQQSMLTGWIIPLIRLSPQLWRPRKVSKKAPAYTRTTTKWVETGHKILDMPKKHIHTWMMIAKSTMRKKMRAAGTNSMMPMRLLCISSNNRAPKWALNGGTSSLKSTSPFPTSRILLNLLQFPLATTHMSCRLHRSPYNLVRNDYINLIISLNCLAEHPYPHLTHHHFPLVPL